MSVTTVRPTPTSGTVPPVVSAGLQVPVAGGGTLEYANLDHAASTPALVCVADAVQAAARTYSSVHRGNGFASRVTSGHYEAARAEVARFVGARADDVVVFTRHTTESVNLLAAALPVDTEVFVFDSEHHATLLPWPREDTVRLPVPRSVDALLGSLEGALAVSTASRRLVVVAGASNVTGEVWPIEDVVAVAARHGARVAVDAAQLAPHRALDIAASGVDYVAFSGHKLYAPYGAGVLVGRRDWLDAARPHLRGGGASAAVTCSGVRWHTGAARHEAGSPNTLGAIAIAAACASLRRSRAEIEAHEASLFDEARSGLEAVAGVRLCSVVARSQDRVPVLAFTVEGMPSALVSAALSAEHGIGVRDGKFCAHLLVDGLLAEVEETSAVRVSIGLGNTLEHVRRLVDAIAEISELGPRHRYAPDADGHLVPVDRPPLAVVTPLW